ncbi:MAG TPA: hypothetical protein VHF25_13760, partial [Nitriliruptorales bacterium]|nr:hypothetical protein [Nitriliruptorales bacterium]
MRRDVLHLSGAAVLVLAATLSLERVFIDHGWFTAGWGAAGLSLAVAFVAHRLRLGPGASAVASAAAFAVFTHVLHLADDGLLPGRAEVTAFTQLWWQGLTDLVQEPAPARTTPGLMLIVSSGVWWLAHGVHEVLVRWRRPGSGIVLA